MTTYNTTAEQSQEHHRATGAGAHPPDFVPAHAQIVTPYGDMREGPGRTFFCMRCNTKLAYIWPNEYTAMMAAHATSCGFPDRQIAVGDYVRWEMPCFKTWADGVVMALGESSVKLMVAATCDSFGDLPVPPVGEPYRFGLGGAVLPLRRIPRPGHAQSEASYFLKVTGTVSHTLPAPTDGHQRIVVSKRNVDTPVGTIETPWMKVPQDIPPTTITRGPTLYDGLTAEECHGRWVSNGLVIEGALQQRKFRPMTKVQIAAAKQHDSDAHSRRWSHQLSAKVAASDAARKLSVLVQLEDD